MYEVVLTIERARRMTSKSPPKRSLGRGALDVV